MTTHEIERRLRMPAHDEPVILPPLLLHRDLPAASGLEASLRPRFLAAPVTMRLVVALLLLLGVLVGAVATGALRLDRLETPLQPAGLFAGRGIELSYPGTWTRLTPPDPLGGSSASVALIVSSEDVSGCALDEVGTLTPAPAVESAGVYLMGDQTGQIFGLEDRIYACVVERPMAENEIRLTIAHEVPQAIATGPIGDFTDRFTGIPLAGFDTSGDPTGFDERIDGMPAKLVVQSGSSVPGADEVRTWAVKPPGMLGSHWFVQATLRGPDLDALRAEADGIARSLRFDEHPPALDEASRDAALATAIDAKDREWRQYPRSRLLACMPRTPGEQAATVTEGPIGPLAEPVEVTCSTSVESTELGLWRAELVATWEAGHGVDAGRWGRILFFDAAGEVSAEGSVPGLGDAALEGDPFPGSVYPTPARLDGPLLLPAGSLVRVVAPDMMAGIYNRELSDETGLLPMLQRPTGSYLVVFEGPVERDGLEWYLVADEYEVGWTVPVADGRPLLEVVDEPACPAPLYMTELAYLQELIRRACVGAGEVTFEPVQAGRRDPKGTGVDEVTYDPDWLAGGHDWELFGRGGADGLDPGLPVALAPSVGTTLPTDGWLAVTGHFDDPASASCRWTYPPAWAMAAEPPELQVRRCQDRFVVTGFEPADAP